MRARRLLLALLLPACAFAQNEEFPDRTEIEPGCYLSFISGECQEPKKFYWQNYGKQDNAVIYGRPVAALLNQAVADRRRLLEWIRYSERLEGKIRRLRGKR